MPRLMPLLALGTLVIAASTLTAQQPNIVHAKLTTASAANGLGAKLEELEHASTPVWVGYSIPITPGLRRNESDRTAFLEDKNGDHYYTHDDEKRAPVDHNSVLLRIANNKIEKLRLEDPSRTLDAGNQRFVWLTDISETDSIHTFADMARQGNQASTAVFFVSIHRSPEATSALVNLAGPANPIELREKAAFWLANQRGHDGFVAVQRMAREDADAKFREKLTFDLTLTKEPGGIDEIIRMAHSDSAPQVRKKAQFWMAVKGGKRVAPDLRDMAASDPEEPLRKSAVFALSRLPEGEAATQLIQVASTSKDPEVRKQAVFWLGQSQDPRALDYLTTLLKQ